MFRIVNVIKSSTRKEKKGKKQRKKDEKCILAINTASGTPVCSIDTPLVTTLGDVPGLGGLFRGKRVRVGEQEERDMKGS